MKQLLAIVVLFLGFLFLGSLSSVAAQEKGTTLRHAYKPFTVSETRMMRARVDNFSSDPQKRLVCVEAFNNATNVKTHLGCLWLDLAAFNSPGMWATEFDAPTNTLSAGNYTVVYTYQETDGTWHEIKSVELNMLRGMFTT